MALALFNRRVIEASGHAHSGSHFDPRSRAFPDAKKRPRSRARLTVESFFDRDPCQTIPWPSQSFYAKALHAEFSSRFRLWWIYDVTGVVIE
jgi:hypothetical protein